MITHVAIKLNGKIYTLPKPNRHKDVIRKMIAIGIKPPIFGYQGFLINGKKFVNRMEAAKHAYECEQIMPKEGIKKFFICSEDLW